MSRSRPALARAAVAAIVLGLGLSACGPAGPTPSPTATGTAEPSLEEPTPTTAGSGPDFSSASAALSNLTSYRFAISSKGFGVAGLAPDVAFTMQGTVVNKPDAALSFKMVGLSGATAISYIVIGDNSWEDLGSGTYIQTPADQADPQSLFDAFQPEALLGDSLDSFAGGWVDLGAEQKGGILTTHYHLDKDSPAGPALVAAYGATGILDAWLAKDGGYLVSLGFSGVQSGETTPFENRFDIAGIDDPANVVKPPPTTP
ncbi:MAG: hypothetical protein ACHQ15_03615 [Candidatus Limnocylindrales bacterium]